MESLDEPKHDTNDPPYEGDAAKHGGAEGSLEDATAEEEIGKLSPLPLPISTRPNLNSLTLGSLEILSMVQGDTLPKYQHSQI